MIRILPLHPEIQAYLKRRRLDGVFAKQATNFSRNPFHTSLHTELLEPRHLRLWSFRVNQKYRAIFIFRDTETVEIIDVNNHYR